MTETNTVTEKAVKRSTKDKKSVRLVGPEGITARYVIVPQILNAGAFLSALYSSTTCQFVNVRYDYDWTKAASFLKTNINFGMLSRETADDESDVCYWYTEQDFSVFFDNSLRTAVVANIISTLTGGLLFLYSLFLWCRLTTKSSIRFLCYVTTFCIVGGVLTHIIFFSKICMEEQCTVLFDGSESACVNSYCKIGPGTYFALMATALWCISLAVTIRLLVKAERQIQRQNLLRKKEYERRMDQQDVEGGRRNNNDERNQNRIHTTDEMKSEDYKDEEKKEEDSQNRETSKASKVKVQKEDGNGNDQTKDDTSHDIKIVNKELIMECTPFSILMGGRPLSRSKRSISSTEEKVEI